MNNSLSLLAGLSALAIFSTAAAAAPPSANSVRVRGTIQSMTPKVLLVSSASGPVRVLLAGPPSVVSVVPSSRAQIKPGSFLGIASVSGPNNTQRAAEVVVFPEAARGTGEGSYDWDLPVATHGHSKMTNGTVSQSVSHSHMTNGTVARSHMTNGTVARSHMTNGTVARSHMTNGTVARSHMTNGTVKSAARGSAITLQYKNGTGMGSQAITLPPNIPVVTFAPGQASQLVPGAHVVVMATRGTNGSLKADQVLVGKNGLTPPM